jgi:hypothetical protein
MLPRRRPLNIFDPNSSKIRVEGLSLIRLRESLRLMSRLFFQFCGSLALRLQLLPNTNFVRVGWRVTSCANGAVRTPVLTDVPHQLPVAHLLLHWSEQYHRRLAIWLRAFQKHDKDGEIVWEVGQIRFLKDFGVRLYARLRELAAHGAA